MEGGRDKTGEQEIEGELELKGNDRTEFFQFSRMKYVCVKIIEVLDLISKKEVRAWESKRERGRVEGTRKSQNSLCNAAECCVHVSAYISLELWIE